MRCDVMCCAVAQRLPGTLDVVIIESDHNAFTEAEKAAVAAAAAERYPELYPPAKRPPLPPPPREEDDMDEDDVKEEEPKQEEVISELFHSHMNLLFYSNHC